MRDLTLDEARELARGYLALASGLSQIELIRQHLREIRRLGLLPVEPTRCGPWAGPIISRAVGMPHWRRNDDLVVGVSLNIDADLGLWYHVSYSFASRLPTHDDTVAVRRAFFDPSAVVVSVWPPEDEYVNHHAFVLHLWQRVGGPRLVPDLRVGGTI